jgi:hypothetical protein
METYLRETRLRYYAVEIQPQVGWILGISYCVREDQVQGMTAPVFIIRPPGMLQTRSGVIVPKLVGFE